MADNEIQAALRVLRRYGITPEAPMIVTTGEYSDYRVEGVFLVPAEEALAHNALAEKHKQERRKIRQWELEKLKESGLPYVGLSKSQQLKDHDDKVRKLENESLEALSKTARRVQFVEYWIGAYGKEEETLKRLGIERAWE